MTVRTSIEVGVDELQRALADDAGFEAWYRRSVPRVYSYLMSRGGGDVALAEDLTQQTFVAAIDQRSRFDGRSANFRYSRSGCSVARRFRTSARTQVVGSSRAYQSLHSPIVSFPL